MERRIWNVSRKWKIEERRRGSNLEAGEFRREQEEASWGR
jgi:hypothetical protein